MEQDWKGLINAVEIAVIILGVITIVIGLVLAGVVDSAAVTGGGGAAASFAGTIAINNLIPLIYRVVILMVGVGMIGLGSAGLAGYGPMRSGM